eukprot:gene5456-10973_t
MAMDLVQLRWQHVRTFEKILELQDENTKFRKQIQVLKGNDQLKHIKAQLRKVKGVIQTFIATYKNNLNDLKLSCSNQLDMVIKQSNESILKLSAKFNEINEKREGIKNDYKSKCDALEKKMEKMKLQLDSAAQSSSQENSKAEGKVKKMKEEADRISKEKEVALKEIETLKGQLVFIQGKLDSSQKHVQDANDECRHLRAKLKTAGDSEQEQAKVFRAAAEQHQTALSQSIHMLSGDNDRLRTVISELEAEVSRLSTVQGDKTSFARFVALKQENAQLQLSDLNKPKDRDRDREKTRRDSSGRRPSLPANRDSDPVRGSMSEKDRRTLDPSLTPDPSASSPRSPRVTDGDSVGYKDTGRDRGRRRAQGIAAGTETGVDGHEQPTQAQGHGQGHGNSHGHGRPSGVRETRREMLIARVRSQVPQEDEGAARGHGPVSVSVSTPLVISLGLANNVNPHASTASLSLSSNPSINAIHSSDQQMALQPGIPLMGKPTRDALRRRLEV